MATVICMTCDPSQTRRNFFIHTRARLLAETLHRSPFPFFLFFFLLVRNHVWSEYGNFLIKHFNKLTPSIVG